MGTTIVVAMFYYNQNSIGHIGDSRANRLHDMELEQVTTNHCFVQEGIDKGLCAEEETRILALGVAPKVEPEVHEHKAKVDDIVLLCSDNLTDLVATMALRKRLCHLVELANASGGRDNKGWDIEESCGLVCMRFE